MSKAIDLIRHERCWTPDDSRAISWRLHIGGASVEMFQRVADNHFSLSSEVRFGMTTGSGLLSDNFDGAKVEAILWLRRKLEESLDKIGIALKRIEKEGQS